MTPRKRQPQNALARVAGRTEQKDLHGGTFLVIAAAVSLSSLVIEGDGAAGPRGGGDRPQASPAGIGEERAGCASICE